MQESYKILLRHIKSETNENLPQSQKDRYLIWSFFHEQLYSFIVLRFGKTCQNDSNIHLEE